jgi:hypothetical protein
MKILPILSLTLAVALGAQVPSQDWTPDSATIGKLESCIKKGDIPDWGRSTKGHSPVIADYARYYTGYMADGQQMVAGEFIVPSGSNSKPAGVYVVRSRKDFPLIYDGGCSIVNIVYSVKLGKIVSLACNGVA